MSYETFALPCFESLDSDKEDDGHLVAFGKKVSKLFTSDDVGIGKGFEQALGFFHSLKGIFAFAVNLRYPNPPSVTSLPT